MYVSSSQSPHVFRAQNFTKSSTTSRITSSRSRRSSDSWQTGAIATMCSRGSRTACDSCRRCETSIRENTEANEGGDEGTHAVRQDPQVLYQGKERWVISTKCV